ncbi:MAG: threonine dehydratase [Paracoccaceae bacterium]
MFSKSDLVRAHAVVLQQMLPTPQYIWPLISRDVGTEVVVKHENHAPTGSFKMRGGVTFMHWLRRAHPVAAGIVTATRGNHGQSQARAARAAGLRAKVLVPHGNSVEKNDAMRALGAELIEFGQDFDEARVEAKRISEAENLFMVPPFHAEILRGVATYGLELFSEHPDLDVVYVPIGCGSGICGLITARNALGLTTDVVGVVSNQANAVKLSVAAGRLIETNSAHTLADGMAVRVPVQAAYDIYASGAARIVEVSDSEIGDAMRTYFQATHNVAEGAGAAALAAARQERRRLKGKKIAVILSGGNVDMPLFQAILAGETPGGGRA